MGTAAREVEDIDFTERLEALNEDLETLNAEARELEETIAKNIALVLGGVGFTLDWNEKNGDICDAGGGTIKTGPFFLNCIKVTIHFGTPVVMPKNIVAGRISQDGIARVEKRHVVRLSQHQLQVGDIVYGRRGDIGRCALITEGERGWLCGTGSLRIHCGKAKNQPLFYSTFSITEEQSRICNQAVGATIAHFEHRDSSFCAG